MKEETRQLLIELADEIENISFCDEDPSQFLRWYKAGTMGTDLVDVECAAFIAAMLSFGNRKQFIPKIKQILSLADEFGGVSNWLLNKKFLFSFPRGEKKFYRFYSYDDMQIFFEELSLILQKYSSLRDAAYSIVQNSNCLPYEVFSFLFPKSKIVPKGKNSANKRIHMFLRWMVRRNSPVDLGIWKCFSQNDLLIPLDVHVMEESIKLGLIPKNSHATLKTAKILTEELRNVFPEDPVRGDFALFGLGVSRK